MTEAPTQEPLSTGANSEALTDIDVQHVQEHLQHISHDGASLYYDASTMASLSPFSAVSLRAPGPRGVADGVKPT